MRRNEETDRHWPVFGVAVRRIEVHDEPLSGDNRTADEGKRAARELQPSRCGLSGVEDRTHHRQGVSALKRQGTCDCQYNHVLLRLGEIEHGQPGCSYEVDGRQRGDDRLDQDSSVLAAASVNVATPYLVSFTT